MPRNSDVFRFDRHGSAKAAATDGSNKSVPNQGRAWVSGTAHSKAGRPTAQRERLNGIVDVIPVLDTQVHARFLLWDTDDVVVSTMN